MMRILIVDDEPLARRGVRVCLRRAADATVVGEAASGEQALAMIEARRPDVVFLDVQMPGMDGFDMVSRMQGDTRPLVVFLTAHDHHALKAFDVHAVDYVVKPIDDGRFDDALQAVRQRVAERTLAQSMAVPMAERTRLAAARDSRLAVRSGGRTHWVDVDDIDWIEASGDYITLHVGPRRHMIHESMDGIEQRLDPLRFARIHRSTIIPLSRVQGLSLLPTRDALVTLRDGTSLRVSRRFRHRISMDRIRQL
ncbi:LytR/AlgR family response regulator transcription factor [Dyella telluris]|uniref:Response regulator transcription factor n=1 Tax=Dyella telluris TaxID=2763498 RepID=A0A7G8Q8P2_9GAMM|nr:LytTR family DNA-binding domain-containing protein [Dyella telluris]QNK03150.1 response regulator transcription factor [Dyella telluris]